MNHTPPRNFGQTGNYRDRTQVGFSLIEVLISIFILSIGIISIASLFPAGIVQQRQTTDDIMGPMVANNALALIRSRVSQEDFGAFEEFNNFTTLDGFRPHITIPGDWPWLRPGFVLEDDEIKPDPLSRPTPYNDQGTVDIFSFRFVNNLLDDPKEQDLLFATQFPEGLPILGSPSDKNLWGIPFNRQRYPEVYDPGGLRQPQPPPFFITQQERYFPMQSQAAFDANGDRILPKKPQYVWDMMFRRFNGRIQVAIFVYRVTAPLALGNNFVYSVQPLVEPFVMNNEDERLSPLPIHLPVRLGDPLNGIAEIQPVASEGAWDADIPGAGAPRFPVIVEGNEPGQEYDPFDRLQSWQEPGQWLLDQNNNIRQVLSNGRDDPAVDPLEVELLRPIAPVSISLDNNFKGVNYYDPWNDPDKVWGGGFFYTDVVTDIWYIPAEVTIDANLNFQADADEPTVTLTPVFLMVKEL